LADESSRAGGSKFAIRQKPEIKLSTSGLSTNRKQIEAILYNRYRKASVSIDDELHLDEVRNLK